MLNVLHWLPVRQRIQYRVASLVWRCQLGLAPAYLMDLYISQCRHCRPLLGARVADPFALLRGEFWWSRLPVQRLCRTVHSLWRALWFGMTSLRSCTSSLDYGILCTDTFLGHLKTYLFVRTGVGSASE